MLSTAFSRGYVLVPLRGNVAPKSHFDANRCSKRNICICNNRRRGGLADPSKWPISSPFPRGRGTCLGRVIQNLEKMRANPSTNLAHADVPEGENAGVVALQGDAPFLRVPEIRIRGKLACFHFGFPIGTPEFVLEQLHPV